MTKQFFIRIQHPRQTCICSLAWNPEENNSLMFADINSQMVLLKDVVPMATNKIKVQTTNKLYSLISFRRKQFIIFTFQDSFRDDLDALFEDEDGDIDDLMNDEPPKKVEEEEVSVDL